MKKLLLDRLPFLVVIGLGVVAITGTLLAQNMSQGNPVQFPPKLATQLARDCIFPIGGWTTIDCSAAAAATSGQLSAWSRYVIQCGDDSYIATGDEATDVADSNDGYLAEGAWLPFITTGTVRYMSCLNINVDSDCRYWECK
jgi:hypothetical protein